MFVDILSPEAPEKLFITRASQIALLLELIGIAQAIGASAQDVENAEQWVNEQMQFLNKAYALMEE